MLLESCQVCRASLLGQATKQLFMETIESVLAVFDLIRLVQTAHAMWGTIA